MHRVRRAPISLENEVQGTMRFCGEASKKIFEKSLKSPEGSRTGRKLKDITGGVLRNCKRKPKA